MAPAPTGACRAARSSIFWPRPPPDSFSSAIDPIPPLGSPRTLLWFDCGSGGFVATPDILQAALTALSEGRIDEARQCFERVLAAEPVNPAALHCVAVIAYQTGAAPVANHCPLHRD